MKALICTALTAGAVLTGAPAAQAADCGRLPAAVQGNPGVRAGQAGLAYLFHDTHGWGLMVTHPGTTRAVVTGTLTASTPLTHLATVHLEQGDGAAPTNGGRTLSFRMSNVGHLDGIRFSGECVRTLKVALRVDGHPLTTQQVFLGSHRVHPTSVPFTVQRG
jgi:hypothetical protein